MRAIGGIKLPFRRFSELHVSFMDYELGYFDTDVARVEPADNPFIPKVLPMSSV